ncbi:energy-coupling factor transporter transmembrane component T family protein [Vannielia litorea]|uniref:energy-coupling factor transporter transmembrane component T family protein n=1 Tax=Vannielia litorea TaxID=1217970 RepID=UPI001BCC162A|nr:energy-coupling factor transporter transmembrane protein EcfT [Vannielia litorea]MBS8228821.1 energy-coupling factor transporter transmembrane protein EcfT [Vannielia litorea]
MITLTSPVETVFHRVPAGVKLGLLCVATTGLFLLGSLAGQLAALGLVAALYALPGARFARAGLAALRPVALFAALIAVWHLATGTVAEGAVIVLRLVSAVALANLVTMTTRLSDMLAVLHGLTAPLRRLGLRTRPLELAISLVIRFIPVLSAKGAALAESYRARSPRRRPGWRIAAPLAGVALDDAERVAEALRARGGLSEGAKR